MEQARVEIEWGWESPEDMRDMQEWFRSGGFEVEMKRRPPAGNGVGFLLPISVLGVALGAFLSGFAGAAGADAWKATKRFAMRAKEWLGRKYPQSPPHDQVTLILRHPQSETIVYVSSEMPDEGFRKLHDLELAPKTDYVWNDDVGEWEAEGPGIAPGRATRRGRLRRLRAWLARIGK